MKKRIPILTIFIVALVALGYILYTPETKVVDTDSDGFADEVDRCPTVASSLNNGCPKDSVTAGGTDEDGDGFFAGFVKDASTQDVNDNDPCVPNKNCGTCDFDKDGITLEQELANNTNPESDDTDKDGLKDMEDSCPIQYGLKESQGCELELDAQLARAGKKFAYNPTILQYCQAEIVIVDWLKGVEIIRSPLSAAEEGMYSYPKKTLKSGFNYTVYLEISSVSKGVRFKNFKIDKLPWFELNM
jgi:hypothetical protein